MNNSCKCIKKNTSFTFFAYFYFRCITVFTKEQDKDWAKSVLNQEHCLKMAQKETDFSQTVPECVSCVLVHQYVCFEGTSA